MNEKISAGDVNDVINKRISEHKANIEKLEAVDGMIPRDLIDNKI